MDHFTRQKSKNWRSRYVRMRRYCHWRNSVFRKKILKAVYEQAFADVKIMLVIE